MKKLSTIIMMVALMFAGSQLFAQTNVYLNLSGALPTGDFADGDESDWGLINKDNEGGAGIGFNAGFKFNIATGVNGLRAMITLDGIYNGLNSELRDWVEDKVDDLESQYNEYSLTTPKYLNIPIMGGVNYTYNFNNKFGLFAEAGLGPNLRIITKWEEYIERQQSQYGMVQSSKITSTLEYDPKISLAYQFGGGIELSKRFIIGISYYNLGAAKVKGKLTTKVKQSGGGSDTNSETISLKRITPTMVMLRVGFKL